MSICNLAATNAVNVTHKNARIIPIAGLLSFKEISTAMLKIIAAEPMQIYLHINFNSSLVIIIRSLFHQIYFNIFVSAEPAVALFSRS